MALPGPAYVEARRQARYHVQVELAHAGVVKTPAHVPVTGHVRRIFRGDDRLGLGDEVHFKVAVCRPGDSLPPGAGPWRHLRDFEAAKYMEVFLDGTPPECQVVLGQCFVIAAPLDTPSMPAPTEEEVAAAWAAFDRQEPLPDGTEW